MASKFTSDGGNNEKSNEEKDDDLFEDATEQMTLPASVDLVTGITEARIALDMFLNNHFEAAKCRMEPLADRSIYHALGYGTVMFLQAAVTMEAAQIQRASDVCRKSVDVCHKNRKRHSLATRVTGKSGKKAYYQSYTDEQAHAELCYAECLLERAFLMFIEDETLSAMIKGALKIRECYKTYQECWRLLKYREWKDESIRQTFESGVRMGVGAFNLLISMLPSKILKLLEFVGFSGDKQFGLTQLTKAAALSESLRAPLCTLGLLFFYIFAKQLLGVGGMEQTDEAKRLIEPCMKKYKDSAMFLFFDGRLSLVTGQFESAMSKYQRSIDSQSEWVNLHHICYWELLWCHCFQGDWLVAMKYAERLATESRWSKATYLYVKAAMLIQYGSEEKEGNSPEMEEHITKIMQTIPNLIQRFAGKALPIEKFSLKKANRYLKQGKRLTLPSLELLFVWNGFKIMAYKPELLQRMLLIVENEINYIVSNKDKYPFYYDDYCLGLILKGTILKYSGKVFQAQQCFLEILENTKNMKEDHYLLSYGTMELAQIAYDEEKYKEARKLLEKARSFKSYSLESRLHFRMHAMSSNLRAQESGKPVVLTGAQMLAKESDSLNSWGGEGESPVKESLPVSLSACSLEAMDKDDPPDLPDLPEDFHSASTGEERPHENTKL